MLSITRLESMAHRNVLYSVQNTTLRTTILANIIASRVSERTFNRSGTELSVNHQIPQISDSEEGIHCRVCNAEVVGVFS